MSNWSKEHYERSKEAVICAITEKDSRMGDFDRFIIQGKNNLRRIHFPAQVFKEVWKAVKDLPHVKNYDDFVIGAFFYEGAYIDYEI